MKTFERLVLKYLIQGVYAVSCLFSVKKRVVFATYRMTELKDNFKFIHEEIKKQELNYETVCLFKKPGTGILGKLDYVLHLMKATFYMATSEFFIIDDFYFPVYVVKIRKKTEVVQVWHACGAFKKFGYSILEKEYGADNHYIKHIPIHKNYSHVLVSAKEVAKHYAQAFNMSEANILPIGIPRTDIYFDQEATANVKRQVYERYPQLIGKKLVLYAPTFRGSSQSNATMSVPFKIQNVLDVLGEDTILGFKMHPFVKDLPDLSTHQSALDLSSYPEINDILLVTDVLITDYSSIVFEFSLLERPMVFYADDLDQYEGERDFYYAYESFVPGPIVKSTEELVDVLQEKQFDISKVKAFKAKFFDYHDSESSKRFVDKVILKRND